MSTLRIEKALNEIGKFLDSHPNDLWAIYQRAECLHLMEREEEAERDAVRVQKAGYDPVAVALLLGKIYHKMDKADLAELSFKKALDLAPQSSGFTMKPANITLNGAIR